MTTVLPDYENTIAVLTKAVHEKIKAADYGVLFTTQCRRSLMRTYLTAIAKVAGQTMSPEDVKVVVQHYTCAHCAKFMMRVGNIVIANGTKTKSLYWDASVIDDPFFKQVVTIMAEHVEASAITGVYATDGAYLEYTPKTQDKEGNTWEHHYIDPLSLVHRRPIGGGVVDIGTYRRQIAKLQTLVRLVDEVNFVTVNRVIQLFHTKKINAVHGSVGTLEDFAQLLGALTALNVSDAKQSTYRQTTDKENLCWIYAMRHTGLMSLRTSTLGNLLLACSIPGNDDAAIAAWKSETNPLNYRRTTAPASVSQVNHALKYLEENDWLPSLEQREAAEVEIPAHWVAKNKWAPAVPEQPEGQKSFADFANKPKEEAKTVDLGELDIGYVFNNLLPSITSMAFNLTNIGSKPMLVNAMANKDAKPIFKWDKEGDRKYLTPWRYDSVFHFDHEVVDPTIVHGPVILVPVLSVGSSASIGFHDAKHDPVLCFFLHGVDYSHSASPALFADSIKGELYDYRRAIEDYSASTKIPRATGQRALGLTVTRRNPVNHTPFLLAVAAVLNEEAAQLYGGREVTFKFDINGYITTPVLDMDAVIYDRNPAAPVTEPAEPEVPTVPTQVGF